MLTFMTLLFIFECSGDDRLRRPETSHFYYCRLMETSEMSNSRTIFYVDKMENRILIGGFLE